jgi:hypothetical protein
MGASVDPFTVDFLDREHADHNGVYDGAVTFVTPVCERSAAVEALLASHLPAKTAQQLRAPANGGVVGGVGSGGGVGKVPHTPSHGTTFAVPAPAPRMNVEYLKEGVSSCNGLLNAEYFVKFAQKKLTLQQSQQHSNSHRRHHHHHHHHHHRTHSTPSNAKALSPVHHSAPSGGGGGSGSGGGGGGGSGVGDGGGFTGDKWKDAWLDKQRLQELQGRWRN